MELLFDTDVNHLGVLIGNRHSERIVALSTSDVFINRLLIPSLWGKGNEAIDSGFQAHLYTRPEDIFVVRVQSNDFSAVEKVQAAIGQNCVIWDSLAGIRIASPKSSIALASDYSPPKHSILPDNYSWHKGSLPEVAASLFRKTGYSLIAFTFSSQLAERLKINSETRNGIGSLSKSTSFLMDKNSAMELFRLNGVNIADTWLINKSTAMDSVLSNIPSSRRYVLKPAGGAAGIGLYSNNGLGAGKVEIVNYITEQKRKNLLPDRFQVQEFISGKPYGVSACFSGSGRYEILEIHQQNIDKNGRYTGGRWTPAIEKRESGKVAKMYAGISGIAELDLAGIICMDFIDSKIIEVNPRVTASAPIGHVLRLQDRIRRKQYDTFRIRQIDQNTRLNIPFEAIENGLVFNQAKSIWDKYGVLCLPQGLNPFGTSRMIYINDDTNGTAQKEFNKGVIQPKFVS